MHTADQRFGNLHLTYLKGAAGLFGTESILLILRLPVFPRGGSGASLVLSSSVEGVSARAAGFGVTQVLSGGGFSSATPGSALSFSSNSSSFQVLPPVLHNQTNL